MTVMDALRREDIEILEYQELDTVRLEDLTSIAFSMPAKTQAVIGIGGGKVIDGAKYCGFLRDLPFISIPTSASSDGFSSASASLLVEGRRKSVPARLAYGIVADTNIIRSAPTSGKRAPFLRVGTPIELVHLNSWQNLKRVEELYDSGRHNDIGYFSYRGRYDDRNRDFPVEKYIPGGILLGGEAACGK